MITIVKAIAVGTALSGAPAAPAQNLQPAEVGPPVIRLDHAPAQRVLPLAPTSKFAFAAGRLASSATAEGRATEARDAASLSTVLPASPTDAP